MLTYWAPKHHPSPHCHSIPLDSNIGYPKQNQIWFCVTEGVSVTWTRRGRGYRDYLPIVELFLIHEEMRRGELPRGGDAAESHKKWWIKWTLFIIIFQIYISNVYIFITVACAAFISGNSLPIYHFYVGILNNQVWSVTLYSWVLPLAPPTTTRSSFPTIVTVCPNSLHSKI